MALKAVELDAELIDTVCTRVRERLPEDQARPCEKFVRQYYHWVPPEDIADRSPLDLYGAAVAHWNLAQQRKVGVAKVRVYNPDFEQHGWASPHTVVEVVSDDMPFLVDSITMELGRQGYGIDLVIHPVMRVVRDADGHLTDVLDPKDEHEGVIRESVLHAEVTREPEPERLERLSENIERVLREVRAAVEDWKPMLQRLQGLIDELEEEPPPIEAGEVAATRELLAWLGHNHFTFLGYREYEMVIEDGETGLRAIDGSGLGILRGTPKTELTKLRPKAAELARSQQLLVLTKANSRATVHRPAYLDYIGVKKIDADGKVVGERRFLGLFTTTAYKASVREIPLLSGKVETVLKLADFPPDSHDYKALVEILESYPRDSLFQVDSDQLFPIVMGILGLGERQRVRLFVRRDPLDRFLACLVLIPRDRFNTENRKRVERLLIDAFGGTNADWSIQYSESALVRVHYIIYVPDGIPEDYDLHDIEARLVHATRAWTDDLRAALTEELGEEQSAHLHRRYENAFPAAYSEDWVARSAVADIARLEELRNTEGPIISLYRPLEAPEGSVRCKLFAADDVALSDVLPTFEHMGARVVDERPYEITSTDGPPAWIYDFGLSVPAAAEDIERVRSAFQEAFLGVWRGEFEDDGLNGLVLEASLSGREVTILRATAKYLRQAGIAFSNAYMERTLIRHPGIAALLVKLFVARFDAENHDPAAVEQLVREIGTAIDAVESLDEDRILRSFMSVIQAILRTNYFRTDGPGPAADVGESGTTRPFVSFKLDPARIPLLPLPRPQFEIFVYSPRVEGVHLRGGKVARGGLRWSDRREDFRTEILGLMKAQMVKNALIVPVGSKGGFVVKRPPAARGREALLAEGIACYKTFLSGLLDLTDNIVNRAIVPPPQIVRYDEDDPYLVVAADKGTATFSDIANGVSADYGFWLGDAFASGGSQGYDHKAMGITARGAWESVKRQFRELGTDIQSTDFTVVGIGDMSGDVFGNGMLLSPHIKLVAAFNHMHVFLDPDPDPLRSFEERKRLFALPRSAWSDYDPSLISGGGGVYPRTAKSIPISPQAREVLAIDQEELAPSDLIRAILRAPVDLLWNGGIGTYVKASTESHADAGDKANDSVRVDGGELRSKVVGEGGNLGFTQLGRIEYAGQGGRIYTDAIDNVAGVNCSDHEVNIKILLGALIADGDMTEKQRNELLVEMTDQVGDKVLHGSYTQTQAMSLALAQAPGMIDVHARLIRHLESVASLNRQVEFLPTDEELAERKASHQGLLAPEMAVVMAYTKIRLYAALLDSDLPEDLYLAHDLESYFPAPLPERFSRQMREHRLRREIIATVVANQLVDRAGSTFAFRLGEETGATAEAHARAYAVAREVFEMRPFWAAVQELDNKVDAETQLWMLIDGRRLVERATRWLTRANPHGLDIQAKIDAYADGARTLGEALPDALSGGEREAFGERESELIDADVPRDLARRVASMPSLLPVFDMVEVAAEIDRPLEDVISTYFGIGSKLVLTWLRDRIVDLPRTNRWQALARGALRDDLYGLHRELTRELLEVAGPGVAGEAAIERWRERNSLALDRCLGVIGDIRASRIFDTTTLPVALREVRELIRGSMPIDGAAGTKSHPADTVPAAVS